MLISRIRGCSIPCPHGCSHFGLALAGISGRPWTAHHERILFHDRMAEKQEGTLANPHGIKGT
jgi:hypothetical protein